MSHGTKIVRERIGYLHQSLNNLVAQVGSTAPETLFEQAYNLNQEHVDIGHIVSNLRELEPNELQDLMQIGTNILAFLNQLYQPPSY
uniref:Uncharacterized protein n=1 Tax=Meloidogyne enterolobii TaxID=390850 RepID=A0A6V7WDZ2_MELEN|nr:unnamed protein product [Meloidogyne enterolobii]